MKREDPLRDAFLRHAFKLLLLPFLAACAATEGPSTDPARATATESASPPNVIFIITDDQGYGDLGAHGHPFLKTPELDKLHGESTRFTDFHVSPTCAPTRAALMAGQWANRTGVWHTVAARSMLFEDKETLGTVFSDNGYATGLFGKWHLGDNAPFRPEDRGFQEVVRHGGGGVGQTPDYWNNAYFDDTYFHNGEPQQYEGYCTDIFFSEAKRFIKEQADQEKPFFAYIATNAPHSPFHAPEEYWKPYLEYEGVTDVQALFFGMIANIDENVGALREWLADEGLAENTILVYMCIGLPWAGISRAISIRSALRSTFSRRLWNCAASSHWMRTMCSTGAPSRRSSTIRRPNGRSG